MSRDEIYVAINSERQYQDSKWGDLDDPKYVSYVPAQFVNDIDIHLEKAKKACYDIDHVGVMEELRKIAALAVKCGEVHGMNNR